MNNIIEMFKSIQGEGKYIGIPSIFIRFANCNLSCGFCDTRYSWDDSVSSPYNYRDAIKFISKNPAYKHIVITGGEPLIHQFDVKELINKTSSRDSTFTIETNGSIRPDNELLAIMRFHNGLWSVSPKIHYLDTHYDLSILEKFNHQKNIQWKFVIRGMIDMKDDIEKVLSLIEHGIITPTEPIILQPNGLRTDYNNACRELADYVIQNDLIQFRVIPQFHRICWGQERGK